MQKPVRYPASHFSWIWALLPLLLAAALAVPALNRMTFDVDESSTMLNAGARHLGPFTLAEAIHASVIRSPDQAWGHVVVFSQWGRVAGWSELAIRALPWLTGLLTLAWVYRIGRALFTARIALTATLLLSTSVLFLTYMHIARSYAFVMLFAAIVLWAYWRVALSPRPSGHGAMVALVSGATALLYTHYFGALLLPALALFHLFFVGKALRWWQPVVLLGLAALLALPQVPDLLSGIQHNQNRESLQSATMHYPEVIATFLRFLSNGLLEFRQPFSTLFALALPLPLLIFGWSSRRRRQPPGAVWYLLLTSILVLLLVLGINEWLQVFKEKRVRYLATLWPCSVLLLGMAFMRPSRSLVLRSAGLVAIAMIAFLGVSNFLSQDEMVPYSWSWRNLPVSIAATQAITGEGSEDGMLATEERMFRGLRIHEFYTGVYGDRRVELEEKMSSDAFLERAQGHDTLWILLRSTQLGSPQDDILNVHAHLKRFRKEGWFRCRSRQKDGMTLELLLSPFPPEMLNQARLQFENDIELFAPVTPELREGLLRFRSNLSSSDVTLLARYSLAIHVFDACSGERVAQGDTGVGPGDVVPLCREIDISALPPGDYEVRVALYDWQTGERLNARDTVTDELGDMHTLQRFRLG